jgi:hypothetical protein
MLYRFKSKAGADVVMLGESGDALLQLLGRQPAPQGILQAQDLAALIASLEAGVAADEARFQQAIEAAKADGGPAPQRTGVSLRQRAWPLRELLLQSQRQGADVVWGV